MNNGCPDPGLLLEFARNERNPALDPAVARHVERCAACRQRIRDIRAVGVMLGQSAASRGADCLSDDAIAALAEGMPVRRAEDVAHAAECGYCRTRLASVVKLMNDTAVSSELRALQSSTRSWQRPSRRQLVSGLAIAAAATFVVLGPVRSRERIDRSPIVAEPHREPSVTATGPVILSPTTMSGSDSLRWAGVPQADLYRVRVWDREGTVVWSTETRDSTAAVPDVLQRGQPYHWEVSARTGWDRWVSSDLSELTLGEGRAR